MRRNFVGAMACALGLGLFACSDPASDDDDGCGSDLDCGDGRICEDGECVNRGSGGSGGTGAAAGGTGAGTGGTGAGAGGTGAGTGGTGGVGTGGTAGSGSGTTIGEHCEFLMGSYCHRRYDECEMTDGYDACFSTAMSACCDTRCGEPTPALESEVDACATDLELMTCAQILASQQPASCAGVLVRN